VGSANSGVSAVLDFVRGGQTAFKDGKSYDASAYRRAIKTILSYFDKDHRLMSDDRRVWIDVKYV
jgi:hypothetical protein